MFLWQTKIVDDFYASDHGSFGLICIFFKKCVAFVSVLKTAKFVVCKSLRCDMDGWRGTS